MDSALPLLARILMALLFLGSGQQKIMKPHATMDAMSAMGMSNTAFFLYAAAAVELLGGLSILLGLFAQWGALMLCLYLIPVTLIFHTHWADPEQRINLMKNLAFMGGLLLLTSFGPGLLSIDAQLHLPFTLFSI